MTGTSSTKGSITPAWWIRWVSSFDIIKVRICQSTCELLSQMYFLFAGSPHRTQSWIGALDKAGISNIWHGTEARNPYLHALFLFCKHFPQFFILGITWRASAYLVGLPSPFRLVSPLYIEKSTFTNAEILWFIQLCVTRLMDLGLDEEGLFRLSAGQAKVRKG